MYVCVCVYVWVHIFFLHDFNQVRERSMSNFEACISEACIFTEGTIIYNIQHLCQRHVWLHCRKKDLLSTESFLGEINIEMALPRKALSFA